MAWGRGRDGAESADVDYARYLARILGALLISIAATALLAVAYVRPVGVALAIVCAVALMGPVIAAVHHAEANRVGEPFGTLVLATAITIIEVAKDLVLLVLTFVVASITLVSGRTHVMQGVTTHHAWCPVAAVAAIGMNSN